MSIHTTVIIRCDKCGDSRADYTPAPSARVFDAMVIAERKAASQGWDVENVHHLCPTCAREKKHGPAQWTHEVKPGEGPPPASEEDSRWAPAVYEPERSEG